MLNLIQFLLTEEMSLKVVVHVADLIQDLDDVKTVFEVRHTLIVEFLQLLLSLEADETAQLIESSRK